MGRIRACIGLGNPGSDYAGTRHNIGFDVIDELASTLNAKLSRFDGETECGSGMIDGREVFLAKPLTYMNNSGLAVRPMIELRGLTLEQVVVVVDDFHLPLGSIRLRPAGSDGGHNGLRSIIYQMQSMDFPRLRCGIGNLPEEGREAARFVLSRFEKHERPVVREMTRRAADALVVAATEGIEAAMSRFNTKKV